jgi:hypothetical protein
LVVVTFFVYLFYKIVFCSIGNDRCVRLTGVGQATASMTSRFLGGVRDNAGVRGFVPVGKSDVVALALGDGRLLWTKSAIGIPVAANGTHLVTLNHRGDRFVLQILDAASGDEGARIENFGMPDNANETFGRSDALTICAEDMEHRFKISWSMRLPYRGGSPPPSWPERDQEWHGAVLVDPVKGSYSPWRADGTSHEAPPAVLEAPVTSGPDSVFLAPVGDKVFSLKLRGAGTGETAIVADARDQHSGDVVWETELPGTARTTPAKLRP